MTEAVAEPQETAPDSVTNPDYDIWPEGVKIEVIGITGDYESGKTLFGASIDPERTLYYDLEKSAGTYNLPFTRIDVPNELLKIKPEGYTAHQLFAWWHHHVSNVPAGKYSVIMVDPVSDIEAGMVEWVKSKHAEFGYSTADKFVSMGGVFWATVKAEWKKLLTQIATRCQTFAFASHLRSVWVGGKPTTRQEPKGKDTLMELASLYLWMERPLNPQDGKKQKTPSAKVVKSRLAITKWDSSAKRMEIVPILPPYMKACDPETIRKYIISPPDYQKLKVAEKVPVREMTADEKLEKEEKIAEDTRIAQESALKIMDRKAELRAMDKEARERLNAKEQKKEASMKPNGDQRLVAEDPIDEDKCNASVAADIIETAKAAGVDVVRLGLIVKKRTGGSEAVQDMTPADAEKLLTWLRAKVQEGN